MSLTHNVNKLYRNNLQFLLFINFKRKEAYETLVTNFPLNFIELFVAINEVIFYCYKLENTILMTAN